MRGDARGAEGASGAFRAANGASAFARTPTRVSGHCVTWPDLHAATEHPQKRRFPRRCKRSPRL